jgi:AraC-like DNA-binding protein
MNQQQGVQTRMNCTDQTARCSAAAGAKRASIWVLTERHETFADVLDSLRGELFEVRVVTDGWNTYYEAASTPPSMLVVDGALTSMDAIAFCCLMKGAGWLARIPIVFIDVEAASSPRFRALRAGASDCITFPFLAEELLARLRLQLKRTRQVCEQTPCAARGSANVVGPGNTQTAIELIKGGDVANLNARSIARQVGASDRRLTSQFKASLGVSVSTYLRTERMERAAWLLKHTGISVSAVAQEVGFRTPCNFTVAFKRFMGMSPSAFRNGDIPPLATGNR